MEESKQTSACDVAKIADREGAMVPAEFTTTVFAPREQFDAWRTWYGSVFDTTTRVPADKGFAARKSAWLLGGLTVSRVSGPALHMSRTKALVKRNPVDHWVITVYKRGALKLIARGASLSPRAGVPIVISLADEIEIEKRSYERVRFYLARDCFRRIGGLLDGARANALDTVEGRLLADYMFLLVRSLPHLPSEDGPRLVTAVETMLAACLSPSVDRMANASGQMDFTLMERVRRTVRDYMHSASLGPDTLCHEAGTSRSQLYRLLQCEGGVAHYIQRQRLAESFTTLCDPANVVSIARIAEALCFGDPAGFSRAFRREFGMSPREVRAAALAGLPPVIPVKNTPRDAVHSFIDCLRGF
jgi:AraC-like DNA-binding protein